MNGPYDWDDRDERSGAADGSAGPGASGGAGKRDDADWFDGGWEAIRRPDPAPPDREADAGADVAPPGHDADAGADADPAVDRRDAGAGTQRPPAPDYPAAGSRSATVYRATGATRQERETPARTAAERAASRAQAVGEAPARNRTRGGDEDGGRRLRPAGYVLLTLIIGFGLASLLLAPKLASLAKDQPFGAKRDLLVALTKPLTAVSSLLRLDKPQAAVESALGRGKSQEQTGLATRPHPSGTPTASSHPSGGPSTPPGGGTLPPPGSFTPTHKNQLAMWVGGDSMAMIFGQSLLAMAQPTRVIDAVLDYKVSSGLSRPDFFDWPERMRAQMQSFDPHVAVAMFGTNDGQSVQYQGKVLQFDTPAWLALYHKRVGDAMDILIGPQHRQVWWIGLPIMRSGAFSRVVKILDSVYKEEAASRPEVHWVDTYAMFADKQGHYQDYLPGPSGQAELMRQSDGIHFSRAGADLAARVVLAQIEAFWHIK
jgi:uncharacterized protein